MISEMIIARNGSEKEQLIAVCTATKILHPRTATSFANISLLSRSLSHAPHRCGMLLQTLQLCVLWSVLGILVSPAKTDEQIKMPLLQNHVGPTNHVLDLGSGCTLATPVKYDRTICAQRRWGLRSNYFDHLLYVCDGVA